MRKVALWAGLVGLLALTTGLALVFTGPTIEEIWCDGSYPRWMLEATDYNGSGCTRVLPSSAAPPDADWTMVCIGLCTDVDQQTWP